MPRIVVIGGGISGLATAYLIQQHAQQANIPLQVQLIEKEARVGGKIWSKQHQGYLCEWGPNGFLTNKPQTLQLCKSLAIDQQLLPSNHNARKRFVYAAGQLHALPHGLKEFIRQSLLSWPAKLRICAELFIPKRQELSEESLADFARRRLGSEALDKLILPMAGGIFAGDPEKMSVAACFPRINQLEQEYGSLIKALLCLAWQKKASGTSHQAPAASAAGPGGVLTSFAGGLQELTDRLRAAIGSANIIKSAEVTKLEQTSAASFNIYTTAGPLSADKVVCSIPAYAASNIFTELSAELSLKLAKINYSPLIVVCFGYSEQVINCDLNGFGYLLAKGETIPLLGTLWDSSIFIQRAPAGKVLLRSMLGGARYPQLIGLSDQEIQQIVEDSLDKILGIKAKPEMVQIFRHQQAIPQYQPGHLGLVEDIYKVISCFPGLYLNGNGYSGVGINDCVAAAYKVTGEVLADLS